MTVSNHSRVQPGPNGPLKVPALGEEGGQVAKATSFGEPCSSISGISRLPALQEKPFSIFLSPLKPAAPLYPHMRPHSSHFDDKIEAIKRELRFLPRSSCKPPCTCAPLVSLPVCPSISITPHSHPATCAAGQAQGLCVRPPPPALAKLALPLH